MAASCATHHLETSRGCCGWCFSSFQRRWRWEGSRWLMSAFLLIVPLFICGIRLKIPRSATHRSYQKNNQSHLTVLTFWLFQLLRQPDLMKCSLINLMFSNCLSWFWGFGEGLGEVKKINCQNSQSKTVNSVTNFSLTPEINVSSSHYFFFSTSSLWMHPSHKQLWSWCRYCRAELRYLRYLRFAMACIFLKGFPVLCFEADFVFTTEQP